MLDITLLRKDLPSVVARLETRKKNQTFLDVAKFSALEAERKTLQTRTEELQARRNSLNKQIGPLKAKGESVDALMAEVNGLKTEQESSLPGTGLGSGADDGFGDSYFMVTRLCQRLRRLSVPPKSVVKCVESISTMSPAR